MVLLLAGHPVHLQHVARDHLVAVHAALILHDEDQVKTREDGCLQVNVVLCAFEVVIPAGQAPEAQRCRVRLRLSAVRFSSSQGAGTTHGVLCLPFRPVYLYRCQPGAQLQLLVRGWAAQCGLVPSATCTGRQPEMQQKKQLPCKLLRSILPANQVGQVL